VSSNVPVRLCSLVGREQDAATKFDLVDPGGATTFVFEGNYEVFDELLFQNGGVVVYPRECGARSNFWANNYDYPNANESAYGSSNSFDESFEVEGEVVLLTAGLIPVLL